jgi:hypothetical protein
VIDRIRYNLTLTTMANAPILLFTFNRLWHTQQTIEALSKNLLANESKLIVFSDGPRNEADKAAVEQIRNYLSTVTGFQSVEVIQSVLNKGLSQSITEGVKQALEKYESVIVLEDDLVTSPYFLSYLNQGLRLYAEDEKVISIHGYLYPVEGELPSSFFIRGADCWGWATWRRGWELFEADGKKLLKELRDRKLVRAFDFNDTYPFTKMLEDQINGKNNSWAIRWTASAFLKDKLTLYPGVSFVKNIGFDSSGTHSTASDRIYDSRLQNSPVKLDKIETKEDVVAREKISSFFRKTNKGRWSRVVDKFISLIKNRMDA